MAAVFGEGGVRPLVLHLSQVIRSRVFYVLAAGTAVQWLSRHVPVMNRGQSEYRLSNSLVLRR